MGVTIAVALPLLGVQSYTEYETIRTKLKQIELDKVAVESDTLEVCSFSDAYVLPEDFESSALLDNISSNLEHNVVYQLIMFLIEADPETEEELQEISGDVLLGLDEGDLTQIGQNVISIYVFEYDNA